MCLVAVFDNRQVSFCFSVSLFLRFPARLAADMELRAMPAVWVFVEDGNVVSLKGSCPLTLWKDCLSRADKLDCGV